MRLTRRKTTANNNIVLAKVGLKNLDHQLLNFWPSLSNLALANRGLSGQASDKTFPQPSPASIGNPVLLKSNTTSMRHLTAFLLIISLADTAYAQGYINSTRSASKKVFAKYINTQKYQATINETDSSLTFLLRDPKVQNLDIFLHFDKRGKCDSEIITLSCDSCYHKYLNNILSRGYYKWTKVDTITYFAKSRYKLVLTTGLEKPFSFMTRRSTLNASDYKQIIRKINKE